MAGEERTYTIRLWYFDDSTKPAYLNRSGWRADVSNDHTVIHQVNKCWTQRRARNKARKWVRHRALEVTKVTIIEVLEGS